MKILIPIIFLLSTLNIQAETIGDLSNSEVYSEVEIVEEHFHNFERLISCNQNPTATVFADTSGTAFYTYDFTAAADSTFGTALQILGADDTPIRAGTTQFDFHKIMITAVNSNTLYKMRIYFGATASAGEIAGDFTDIWFRGDDTNPQQSNPIEVQIMSKRFPVGTCVWAAIANAAGAQTASLVFAIHEYSE